MLANALKMINNPEVDWVPVGDRCHVHISRIWIVRINVGKSDVSECSETIWYQTIKWSGLCVE